MKARSFVLLVPILASLLSACNEQAPSDSGEGAPLQRDLLAGEPAFVSVPRPSIADPPYLAVRKDLLPRRSIDEPRPPTPSWPAPHPGVVDPPDVARTYHVVEVPGFEALPGAAKYVVLDL